MIGKKVNFNRTNGDIQIGIITQYDYSSQLVMVEWEENNKILNKCIHINELTLIKKTRFSVI